MTLVARRRVIAGQRSRIPPPTPPRCAPATARRCAFLGARAEILSLGIEEEGFGAGAAKNAMTGTGFIQDANDALFAFKTMTPRERKHHFAQFEEVRDKVRMRFMDTTAANQQAHAKILDGYNAQQRPRSPAVRNEQRSPTSCTTPHEADRRADARPVRSRPHRCRPTHLIDYRAADFTATVRDVDVVLETIGEDNAAQARTSRQDEQHTASEPVAATDDVVAEVLLVDELGTMAAASAATRIEAQVRSDRRPQMGRRTSGEPPRVFACTRGRSHARQARRFTRLG
jgi:hypothetical protein